MFRPCSFLMFGRGAPELGLRRPSAYVLPGVRVGRPPVWTGADRPCVPLFFGEHLVELRDAGVPRGHRQRPRRGRDRRGDLQGVVVDHDESLGLGHVTGSQLVPAEYVAEGQARASPGDDVLGLGAVLPVGLEVRGGDGRPVLEHRVLAQLDRPDGPGVVDLVAHADVWTDHTGLVDLVDRPVNPRREDPLSATVTPGGHAAVTVRDRDLLGVVQSDAGWHDGPRVYREDRRDRHGRCGRNGRCRRSRCSRRSRRVGRRWDVRGRWRGRRLDDRSARWPGRSPATSGVGNGVGVGAASMVARTIAWTVASKSGVGNGVGARAASVVAMTAARTIARTFGVGRGVGAGITLATPAWTAASGPGVGPGWGDWEHAAANVSPVTIKRRSPNLPGQRRKKRRRFMKTPP